ncbi:hypothetical protein [Ferruginibacter sp.]|uniref:hypothetical protein n=1 Tax=Ferruginibacter sp. TaxID=1940288 RepID=UPI0019C22B05|nr:hypothetical protein [Ferruginibacter sp.]MBC7626597.1 hypothetical protein [Ferruginibacter sp.]
MKKYLFIIAIISFFSCQVFSQVGIGNSSPAAKLHIYSTGSLTVPNMLVEEATNSDARVTFKNTYGKSFTVAAPANVASPELACAWRVMSKN